MNLSQGARGIMNFRQLDCFVAAAECGSFSAAAKRLYLSQSAVSQQIIALENELGCALFERAGHAVTLTAAGEYFFPRIIDMRETLDSAVTRTKSIAHLGNAELVLGYDGPLAEAWIAEALENAVANLGSCAFLPRRSTLAQLTDLLMDNAVDLIVTCDTEVAGLTGVQFVPLATQGPCVFFPPGHRYERMRYVEPVDLEGEIIISAYNSAVSMMPSKTANTLMASGITGKATRYFPDGDTAFLAVRIGLGIFIASHLCDDFATRHHVKSVDLKADLPLVTLGVAWKQDDKRIETFAKAAKGVLARRMKQES